MSARTWIEAVALAASVGKPPSEVRVCEACGNHYVSALCDNRGGCYLSPQMMPPKKFNHS